MLLLHFSPLLAAHVYSRKFLPSDVGVTLEEITWVLLKSKNIVYELNGNIVPKPPGSGPVLSSGGINDRSPGSLHVLQFPRGQNVIIPKALLPPDLAGSVPAGLLPIICFCSQ